MTSKPRLWYKHLSLCFARRNQKVTDVRGNVTPPPPLHINKERTQIRGRAHTDLLTIGETDWRGQHRAFGIKTHDRRQHTHIVGKTGTGKSTLLKNMAIADIRAGRGIALIDPHGDLVEDILHFIPKSRMHEVVHFNPHDVEYPMGLNAMETSDEHGKATTASSLVSVFRHIWSESWGPRTEYILRNAVLAVMDAPGGTLLDVYRMLGDDEYRETILRHTKDPIVRSFWERDFRKSDERYKREAVAPVQNKVGQLLTHSTLRNIVGQPKSTVDLAHLMDSGQIFLANLSKGRIGEGPSNLLGSVTVTRLYLAALQRASQPEHERRDFHLYIDEFQNFTTEAFPSILSEARKYRLNLTIAHQYIDQLSDTTRKAVAGNVGTSLAFRVGAADAEALAGELGPEFDENDLRYLDNYCMSARLLVDGKTTRPFSARSLPPTTPQGDEARPEEIIDASRQSYASPRRDVESRIEKWLTT